MQGMTNIKGQNFEQPSQMKYNCTKCASRIHMQECLGCNNGSNFKPYKSIEKEGEQNGR